MMLNLDAATSSDSDTSHRARSSSIFVSCLSTNALPLLRHHCSPSRQLCQPPTEPSPSSTLHPVCWCLRIGWWGVTPPPMPMTVCSADCIWWCSWSRKTSPSWWIDGWIIYNLIRVFYPYPLKWYRLQIPVTMNYTFTLMVYGYEGYCPHVDDPSGCGSSKLKNMAKSMAGYSKTPAILFVVSPRFHQRSIWHRHGADACLCFKTVTKTWRFFTRKSTICPTSRISLKPLHSLRRALIGLDSRYLCDVSFLFFPKSTATHRNYMKCVCALLILVLGKYVIMYSKK